MNGLISIHGSCKVEEHSAKISFLETDAKSCLNLIYSLRLDVVTLAHELDMALRYDDPDHKMLVRIILVPVVLKRFHFNENHREALQN